MLEMKPNKEITKAPKGLIGLGIAPVNWSVTLEPWLQDRLSTAPQVETESWPMCH